MTEKNIHEDCENYVKNKDMCLKFFKMGISDVSQYDTCAEKIVYSVMIYNENGLIKVIVS